jgi:hypothetical protein
MKHLRFLIYLILVIPPILLTTTSPMQVKSLFASTPPPDSTIPQSTKILTQTIEVDHLTNHITSPPRPMPPSYVRLKVFYVNGNGGDSGAGATIDTNAILSHNHHLSPDQTPADIQCVVVEDISGNQLYVAKAGDFLMAGDDELGGGLSLFVFKANPFKDLAILGDIDELEPGALAEQAIFVGAKTRGMAVGLYPATINNLSGFVRNQRKTDYKSFKVSYDLTTSQTPIGNDSGAPLYIDNRVYGVNNSGNGNYGAVTDISLIRHLVVDMTEKLHRTDSPYLKADYKNLFHPHPDILLVHLSP